MLINLPHFHEDFSVFDFHFVSQLKPYFQLLGMDRNRNKMHFGVGYCKELQLKQFCFIFLVVFPSVGLESLMARGQPK